MKTTNIILSLLLSILFFSCSKSDDDESFDLSLYTYVPDDNFEQLLIELGYDDKLNDYVLTSSIKNIKELIAYECDFSWNEEGCGGFGIKDLTGIENFEKLEFLNVHRNELTYLDLNSNIYLKHLICSGNKISSLDLSNNPNLEELSIGDSSSLDYGNNITSIDLSNNVNLKFIDCSNNKLLNLDMSNNVNLEYLQCKFNNLSSLDISNNVNLELLWCRNNNLSSLDISNNVNLYRLYCTNNNLLSLDISNNVNLNTMDCSLNPLLECIQVNKNQLTNYTVYDYSSDPDVIHSLDCN